MNMMASLFLFLCILLINAIAVAKRDTYIVHMDSSAMPKVFSSHHGWYTSIMASAIDDDRPSKRHSDLIIYSYTNAIHGFSATLSPSELASIKKSPSFLSATKDTKMKLATTHSSDFMGLNSLSGAWPVSEFGRDVIIGVVDSGIWPESKSFSDEGIGEIPARWKGGCYGGVDFNATLCNKKLIGVRFFNKGNKAQDPDVDFVDSARDDMGHGTHVSSTAAGNFVQGASYFGYASGTAKGMAPRARIAMYKVGKDFSTADVIAAIDTAIEDKIDVLSLSISYYPPPLPPLYHDPMAFATFGAMEKGIFISAVGGNFGPSLKTICNAAPWLLTVGAGTTDRTFSGTVLLGNGAYLTGSSLYPLPAIPTNLPITHWKSCDKGVARLPNSREKIVVCVINDPHFDVDYSSPVEGVAGVVLIWNTPTSYVPDLPPGDQSSVPVIFMSSGTGNMILDYINDNREPTATMWFKETNYGTKPAPKVADASSRGPSPTSPFILKPDVLAPGYQILASWPERTPVNIDKSGHLFSKFKVMSGTSMASPHAAGVAAVLRGAHPHWSPAAIRSAIMTTSNPLDNLLSPIQEQGYKRITSPLAIGAGHISPNKALEPGLVYDVHVDDYVNLLCAMNLTSKQIHAITRSHRRCTKPSLDLNYPSFIAYFNCNKTTSVRFKRTLTNVGDDKSTYYAELAPIEGFNVSVTPKKLVFKKKLQRHRYELKINGPCLEEDTIFHGSITWLKVGGKPCSVRSPIVIVGLNTHNLHGDDDY